MQHLGDYRNPINFLNKYRDFLKDKTFDEFWEEKQISNLQTMYDSSLKIAKSEQKEFYETPNAITFKIKKGDVEKSLPRISYGISNSVAYIYGIQADLIDRENEKNPIIKKINRSRYKVNKKENIPEEWKEKFADLEPYSYISLFVFLCMLKHKGINTVVMPALLPERSMSKKIYILDRIQEEKGNRKHTPEMRHEKLKELRKEYLEYKRIQYAVSNKFIYYIKKMSYDVSGVDILGQLDETSLTIDISDMKADENSNIIFYELYQKICELMKTRNIETEER